MLPLSSERLSLGAKDDSIIEPFEYILFVSAELSKTGEID